MDGQITIVKRDTIPPLWTAGNARAERAGELRDFRWNEQLREFMPETADLSLSWVRLEAGESLDRRALSVDSLLIVYGGSAEIVGDVSRTIAAEDVVVVPSGCKHGFVGGPQGLFALSIQLGETAGPAPTTTELPGADTLDGLLEYNAKRLVEFQQRPVFELWDSGALSSPVRYAAYRDALQLWISQSAALLFARQAGCTDLKYAPSFLSQLVGSLGRGLLVDPAPTRLSSGRERDPILLAFADWFTRQMYVLDNVEKVAIVDLVVTSANAALGRSDLACRFWAYDYAERAAETAALLRGETPRTYVRLRAIVGEAWDMISAMTDRVVQLTEASETR